MEPQASQWALFQLSTDRGSFGSPHTKLSDFKRGTTKECTFGWLFTYSRASVACLPHGGSSNKRTGTAAFMFSYDKWIVNAKSNDECMSLEACIFEGWGIFFNRAVRKESAESTLFSNTLTQNSSEAHLPDRVIIILEYCTWGKARMFFVTMF